MNFDLIPHRIAQLLNVDEDERRTSLRTGLVERDEPMRLMLLAALAGEHALLIGPPGAAKSLLARRLKQAFRAENSFPKSGKEVGDLRFFERLLTQFSVPEELFGPYSLDALEAKPSRFERATEGYLPDAHFAFLDEIFKSNPAILNALLTLLNERVFHDGSQAKQTELIAVVGASNEVPEQGELDALYDRFLVRCEVEYVTDFRSLLQSGSDSEVIIPDDLRFTRSELLEIQAASKRVAVPEIVDDLLELLRARANELALDVSDRRWLKIRRFLQTAALTSGRSAVSPLDVLLVPHCIWSPRPLRISADPQSNDRAPPAPAVVRDELMTWLHERIWSPKPDHPNIPTRMLEAWEQHLQKLAAKNFGDPQAQKMLEEVSAERDKLAAHQQQLDVTPNYDLVGIWLSPVLVKSSETARLASAATNNKLLKRYDSVLAAIRNLLAATAARTLAGMAADSRSTPARLDFSLPGCWVTRQDATASWQQVGQPGMQSNVAWESNQQYGFHFTKPATPITLTRLVRDYGGAPQFVALRLGGASGQAAQIKDISVLREAPFLQELDIAWNIAVDLGVIGALKSLKTLGLSGTPLSSLSGIEPLRNLVKLHLQHSKVNDLKPLKPLAALEELIVSDNPQLEALDGIESLVNLKSLNTERTIVKDLSPLAELQQLTDLKIGKTLVTDLTPLRALSSLSEVFLTNTLVSDFGGLATLQSLRSLYASGCQIVELKPLAGLSLTVIDLSRTKVQSVAPLQYCTHLQELVLESTQLSELQSLALIRSLQKLTLKGVGLARGDNLEELRAALPSCTIDA